MTQTTNTSATSNSNTEQYFNMITTVVGYINRMRVVPGKGKQQPSYLAINFAALCGGPGYDNAETRFFSLTVKGEQANKAIQSLIDTHNDDDKYFAKVEIADFEPGSYEATRDGTNHKKGDTILIMKGRLIKVHFVHKNGERIFELEKPQVVKNEDAQDDSNKPELPANADNDGEFNQSDAGIHAEAGVQDDFNEPELPANADNDGEFNESDAELHAEAHA